MQTSVVSSCTGTQKKETLTDCVITPCMVMKTKGIPSCTGTPGQPRNFYFSNPARNNNAVRILVMQYKTLQRECNMIAFSLCKFSVVYSPLFQT